jgi:phosphatidate cytidylyltransferase
MLKTRIITAVCLMAVFIPAMFLLSNIWWAALIGILALFALAEWADMIGLNAATKWGYVLLGTAIGAYFFKDNFFSLNGGIGWARTIGFWAAVFWCIVAPVWLFTKLRAPRAILAGLGLLLVLSVWLGFVWGKIHDSRTLFVLLSTVWVADSAAYFFGKNFGKHKLAPNISPGKTWEGVAGALIGVSLYSIILQQFDYPVATLPLTSLPIFWAVAVLGVIGDLFESLIKRQFNLKDSGNCIPGHGGIWDRIDGVVSSLPVVLFLMDAIVLRR